MGVSMLRQAPLPEGRAKRLTTLGLALTTTAKLFPYYRNRPQPLAVQAARQAESGAHSHSTLSS